MNWLAYLILPFAAVDAVLKRLYYRVLQVCNWITGWNNITLAQITLLASVVVLATNISIANLERAVPVRDLFAITLLIIGQANSYRSFRNYEQATDDSMHRKLWWDIAIFRHALVVLLVVNIFTDGPITALIFWLPLLTPHYFVTEHYAARTGIKLALSGIHYNSLFRRNML